MRIKSISLEVTRRCNLNCSHCLRGKAQDIILDINYVNTFFKKVNSINNLNFTGGEPSLVPEILSDILLIAKKHDIRIGSYFLSTNGIFAEDHFIDTMKSWNSYCYNMEEEGGKGVAGVQYSNDRYHLCVPETIKRLEGIPYYTPRYPVAYMDAGGQFRYLFKEGYGASVGGIQESDKKGLYLNCKGNIIKGCNWSYQSQNREDLILCHVNDFTEGIYRYFLEESFLEDL